MNTDLHDHECEQGTPGTTVGMTGANCHCVIRADLREEERVQIIVDAFNRANNSNPNNPHYKG